MKAHVLTLFPELVKQPMEHSIVGRALSRGQLTVDVHDIRSFAINKHAKVDDSPYGGGPGMVMTPQPLVDAIEATRALCQKPWVIAFSPAGRLLDQARVRQLVAESVTDGRECIFVCGRYEGIDERVLDGWCDEIMSIGDYVLSGGELAALVVIDAMARLVPGVLGNAASPDEESLEQGLLEYPQYSRPESFRGHPVPEVLLSGDHARIASWRRARALARTRERRPDLFARLTLSAADKKLLES